MPKARKSSTPAPEFENLGSLITYKRDGRDQCLGYLFHSPDRGVFDAELGKVAVPPEHVGAHNAALSKALIEGLDNNCQVGQGGTFYVRVKGGRPVVGTWDGTDVSADTFANPHEFGFRRNGKVFSGPRTAKSGEAFHFTRIE